MSLPPIPIGPVIARLVRSSTAYNALNLRSVNVYIQSFPGRPEHNGRGVSGLDYEIEADGVRVRQGRTGADGKIEVRLPVGMRIVLRILGSEYVVTHLAALHPREEFRGVQQRLEMLGYNPGALHGDNRRADTYNNPSEATERAILAFQTDNRLSNDAQFGSRSDQALRNLMTQSGGE